MAKKYVSGICVLALFSILPVTAMYYFGAPNGVNYTTNAETTDWGNAQFYYDGYIQVIPSYRHNGMHALQGRFTYRVPGVDAQTFQTEHAGNSNAPGAFSVSARVYDSLFDWSNKTTFNFNFTWAPPHIGDPPINGEAIN